jgi:hypothetical protein
MTAAMSISPAKHKSEPVVGEAIVVRVAPHVFNVAIVKGLATKELSMEAGKDLALVTNVLNGHLLSLRNLHEALDGSDDNSDVTLAR